MITRQKIEEGAQAYVLDALVPRMPTLSGVLFATAAPFVIRAKINQVLPLFDGTELVNGELIDIDKLAADFRRNMSGKWPVEMAGFKFTETDLDELMRYVKR